MNRAPRVVDGHVDLLHALMHRSPGQEFLSLDQGPVTPATMDRGGVGLFVSAFYCPDVANGPHTALPFLRSLLDYWRDHVRLPQPVRTPADVAAAWETSGPPHPLFLLENADCLLEMDLVEFHGLGFRLVGLTHAGRNRIGDGNAVPSPGGLTDAGREIVRGLERMGLIIDTAHLSDPAFREVADMTSGPLVSTHTGLRTFCDRPRNLSVEQIKAIAGRAGVIGLALAPEMLSLGRGVGVEEVFVQIDWLVQRFGPSVAGLGSDFGGFEGAVEGLADHAGLGRLTERMDRAGYPQEGIEAIMGGNWYRFFQRTLPP
jgi:membrane dipeptidase